MTIIEVAQGHWNDLTGMAWDDAIQMFRLHDEEVRAKYPATVYHAQTWREIEARNGATAPWGFEWYCDDGTGKLKRHSAHYDSSG